ncbi:hypothetical protein BDF22DRAFT_417106 [Syncephalis plumigaleata]|nr:hypothetical protein BDF22DRAFT_417106 [Syncephalis plumigaleata]
MAAKKKLKGSYGAFRDTVAYPLKRIKVEADGASRPLGNCYVYRYIDGVLLWKYISKENYAEQLITMDETTPQMLQAFIYLYNAGIKHRDIHAGNVLVKKERFGKVKSVLFDFDRVEWFPKSRKLLDVNTRPTKDFGFSHDYACNNFQKAPLLHILGTIPMDADIQSHAIIPEDRNKIKQYIKETVASQKTAPQRLTKTKLEAATKAYISLHRVVKIARQSQDCSSFVAALKTVYPLSLQN